MFGKFTDMIIHAISLTQLFNFHVYNTWTTDKTDIRANTIHLIDGPIV